MEDWSAAIILGLIAGATVWGVWYLTKAPRTATAVANGLCNPGVIARFINVEILLQSGGAALAVGALKGGYDRIMMRRMLKEEREALNEEREARQQAERQLAEERKRNNDSFAMLTEIVNELRAERQQNIATQQALLDNITRLAQRGNGNGHADNAGD